MLTQKTDMYGFTRYVIAGYTISCSIPHITYIGSVTFEFIPL